MTDGSNRQDIDEALAWCLAERDSGNTVTEQQAIETFPELSDELKQFFEDERQLAVRIVENLPPVQIAQYELRSELGYGSFGVVHRAWDTRLHRFVAIKTPRHVIGDDKSRSRFLREARTASQLAHPNIVRTIEIGEFESTPYIVSEIVDGQSLRKWMSKPITPRAAVEVALGITAGLDHAHQHGVIHRDLTPNNVLVNADDHPRILDFGLAKLLQSEATVSITGEVLGTPAYVSPEQVSGGGHEVDARTDVYSVGVILYEMLTQKRPFDGEPKLLLHRIQFEQAPNAAEVTPSVPASLAAICHKCLEKEPGKRYQSAKSLTADLQNFLSDEATPKASDLPQRSMKRTALYGLAAACIAAIAFFSLPRLLKKSTAIPKANGSAQTEKIRDPSIAIAEDTTKNDRPEVLAGHRNVVASADFRPDGQQFVSCGHDGLVIAWDWKTGEQVWTNNDHEAEVWSADWSPDGNTIATASWDNNAHILDAVSGKRLITLEGHSSKVCCVQFSPDGSVIATAALDGTIRLWDSESGKETGKLDIDGAEFVNCQFSEDGRSLVATGWKGRLAKWDLTTNQRLFVKTAHKSAAWTVCFIPHESAIATAGEDGFIRLWDEKTGSLLKERKAAKAHVTCVRPHPNGRQLMHSSHDKTICVWDPAFEQVEREFNGHEHWVYEFVFHPDGRNFLSTSVDQSIRIWELDE